MFFKVIGDNELNFWGWLLAIIIWLTILWAIMSITEERNSKSICPQGVDMYTENCL